MSDRTIISLTSFTGYPRGRRTYFRAGERAKVPADYADLLADKGLVERPKPAKKKPAPDANE